MFGGKFDKAPKKQNTQVTSMDEELPQRHPAGYKLKTFTMPPNRPRQPLTVNRPAISRPIQFATIGRSYRQGSWSQLSPYSDRALEVDQSDFYNENGNVDEVVSDTVVHVQTPPYQQHGLQNDTSFYVPPQQFQNNYVPPQQLPPNDAIVHVQAPQQHSPRKRCTVIGESTLEISYQERSIDIPDDYLDGQKNVVDVDEKQPTFYSYETVENQPQESVKSTPDVHLPQPIFHLPGERIKEHEDPKRLCSKSAICCLIVLIALILLGLLAACGIFAYTMMARNSTEVQIGGMSSQTPSSTYTLEKDPKSSKSGTCKEIKYYYNGELLKPGEVPKAMKPDEKIIAVCVP